MMKLNLCGLYDASAWVGNWPFVPLRYNTQDALKKKLSEQGICKAILSSLDAVFSQDPTLCAQEILRADREFFMPAPVTDLSRANWNECISWMDRNDVKIIKLLPNYHMYSLEEQIDKLVEETVKRDAVISVQVRMQDARGQYPLLQVKDVDVKELERVVKKYPDQKFLLNGMYMGEIRPFANMDNVRIETSALELNDVFRSLTEGYPQDRFVFGTHTPLFFPEGNLFKLGYASISDQEKNRIGRENLSRFLGIE
jgi:predicted TIM-barrel fold metal-dependent hydrolase